MILLNLILHTLIEIAKILLNEIASYIKNQPESKWRIEGHTDNQGSAYSLKKLSYDRAKTVFDYLVSEGLSPEQFQFMVLVIHPRLEIIILLKEEVLIEELLLFVKIRNSN